MSVLLKQLILVWVIILPVTGFSQIETDTVAAMLPNLTLDYYNGYNIENRSYNYELMNQKRQIEKLSADIFHLSSIAFLLADALVTYVGINNDWSLWVTIPVGIAAGAAAVYPIYRWSKSIRKKAKSIEVSPVVGAYTNTDNIYGISVTASF
ncbi:MAG: hypothetical protein SPK72_07455 [Bacteroidales bacterium]|nr:hypothetical protein [Bacteroidales bacterium]